MRSKKFKLKPLSLRARFLCATSAVILALTLSYGIVAILGYLISFDKTTYTLLRSQSNLIYSLVQWQNNKIDIRVPPNFTLNNPTLIIIYNENGQVLWRQREVPNVENLIRRDWLKKEGLYEIDTDIGETRQLLQNNPEFNSKLDDMNHNDEPLTHSVSVNQYGATENLPPLTIVVVDTLPQDLQKTGLVWEWFGYVLLANLILVIPLLWLAAYWSLRPIKSLVSQISSLEKGEREMLDENPPNELRGLVRNLNNLLTNERKRYSKYRTTLSDLTHSLKTPLAVLQSTLRSLRTGKQMTIEQAEPIMLEQIGRISQQVGYYLHRASTQGDNNLMLREITSVPSVLDSLASALHKVYQNKGVSITVDISPEITWLGQPNDFMEVMGNIMENACKYCLEFVEVTAAVGQDSLVITVDDDGPGVPESQRNIIFVRGQRVDTLRPGQGLGLSIALEIIDQYDGNITISDSPLGGARVQVTFRRQSVNEDS
ncbi:two-component system sensor histidine kinase PhoQ [Providencia vermicola]|uniref:histidine kinase n=2 Tax=Providencia TaxID=586 RepID=A0AAI9MUN5_PROST|nr:MULTISPECIES: two-component system sensor histidine kinase PhoQ [Providencia]ELR5045780.1 two-component system sensor histidine kinase PhoQ [Providencia rettgeri]ELR5033956.1 two-component system sensor histidine kinase PhoQ [Providencia stuartii]ELR5119678.1 two-component system sensor histidine kinase PhoQ [Providencia stuartii]ELR5141422.1 two-component system sensor histidine kinase PhoQ [Providencia stuartii]ELR5290780.1 two-component system sensor histidine kinase PhoQ [Providencia st